MLNLGARVKTRCVQGAVANAATAYSTVADLLEQVPSLLRGVADSEFAGQLYDNAGFVFHLPAIGEVDVETTVPVSFDVDVFARTVTDWGIDSENVTVTVAGADPVNYSSCEEAEATGEQNVQGSEGPGKGYPNSMVPIDQDGDSDGVVYEK